MQNRFSINHISMWRFSCTRLSPSTIYDLTPIVYVVIEVCNSYNRLLPLTPDEDFRLPRRQRHLLYLKCKVARNDFRISVGFAYTFQNWTQQTVNIRDLLKIITHPGHCPSKDFTSSSDSRVYRLVQIVA